MVDALFVALCVLIANHFGGATPYGHEKKGVVCMGIKVYGMWSGYDVGEGILCSMHAQQTQHGCMVGCHTWGHMWKCAKVIEKAHLRQSEVEQ